MIVERWSDGVLVEEWDDGTNPPPFPPLDAAGALATLLVVEGVLPLDDAAHSVGTTSGHLIHEAEAWSVGA